jgi:hypothetical protein
MKLGNNDFIQQRTFEYLYSIVLYFHTAAKVMIVFCIIYCVPSIICKLSAVENFSDHTT